MSFSINRATLVGNTTKAPELKYTPNGNAVCNFGVATNHSIKRGEQWEDVPTFHNIVVWGSKAEWLASNITKGTKVYIEGRIQNRSYDDKNGVKKYISEIVANEVIPMSARNNAGEESQIQEEDLDGTMFDDLNVDEIIGDLDGEVPTA